MPGAESSELISGADAYERLHVPALFQQWVAPVLDAAGVAAGQRVLDVACGTGVLAREAMARVGGSGSVAGVDPAPGMLEVARSRAPSVEWRTGTAESLPFPDGSFDAVVSQFGLMLFSDRRLALEEMLRVLVPGGRVAVAVWDSLENAPAFATEVALVEEIAGPRAADPLRVPFALGDRRALVRLFQEAGVARVEATTRRGTARYPGIRHLVEADLRGWLPLMGVELPEETIRRILEEAERRLADFVTPSGEMVFDAPAHIVTGRKP